MSVVHPGADVLPLARFGLHDVDTLRLLLKGSSVVDWHRLHLNSDDDIDSFIRVNELDPDAPDDQRRMRDLQSRAIAYLRDHLRYRLSAPIEQTDIRGLIHHASGKGPWAHRVQACMVLKVMHILQYVEAYELLSMLPISQEELATLMQAKIERVVRGLLKREFPIEDFSGNQKPKYSVISKLLAKKDTQAAQVFDKLRFRFIVKRREDIPSLLIALTRQLSPVNYLVPNQSENSLIDIDHILTRAGNVTVIRAQSEPARVLNEQESPPLAERKNDLSGPDYSVVNFVADVPLRLDRVLSFTSSRLEGRGRVVFVTVEMQVVDAMTAKKNESGENRHSLYKSRQRAQVKKRLARGKRPETIA